MEKRHILSAKSILVCIWDVNGFMVSFDSIALNDLTLLHFYQDNRSFNDSIRINNYLRMISLLSAGDLLKS